MVIITEPPLRRKEKPKVRSTILKTGIVRGSSLSVSERAYHDCVEDFVNGASRSNKFTRTCCASTVSIVLVSVRVEDDYLGVWKPGGDDAGGVYSIDVGQPGSNHNYVGSMLLNHCDSLRSVVCFSHHQDIWFELDNEIQE